MKRGKNGGEYEKLRRQTSHNCPVYVSWSFTKAKQLGCDAVLQRAANRIETLTRFHCELRCRNGYRSRNECPPTEVNEFRSR